MSRKNGGIIGPANTPVGGLTTGVAGGVWRMNDVANLISNSQWPIVAQNIENSCRFNDGSTDYLTRTHGSSATLLTKGTFSAWVKRSTVAGEQTVFTGNKSDNNQRDFVRFEANSQLRARGCGGDFNLETTQVFRDASAWMHIVLEIDTTQSTSSDRVKMYVNGSQITDFSSPSYPSQDYVLEGWSNQTLQTVGRDGKDSNTPFDGYMAEVIWVDGQALTPSNFGEFNTATGIWTPRKIGQQFGTVGNNGFYLDFKDSSTLGNDASGKNNDFTVNNLTSIDQTTDTCVVNYATLNPLDFTGSVTASEGNTVFQGGRYKATFGVSSGKWYWEAKRLNAPDNAYIGIKGADGNWNNSYNDSYTVYTSNGKYYLNGSDQGSYGSSSTTNDILIFALDMDNGKFYIGENGTFYNSGDPAASSNPMASSISGTYLPVVINNSASGTDQYSFNFGNPSFSISSGNSDANGFGNFEYAVPSGYYALNTTNLNTYG